MSVNSVSFGNNPFAQGPQSAAFQQRKQDFSALQSALSSGDLDGAKKAFASLQQDTQSIRQGRSGQGTDQDGDNDGSKGAQSSNGGQGKQDFTALQNALNSGDLKGAQQAFASLQQDMQAKSQGHHHHHHHSSSSTSSGTSSTASTSQVGTVNTTA